MSGNILEKRINIKFCVKIGKSATEKLALLRKNTAVWMSHWPHGTLYPQKLALSSPTSADRPVGIVRSQT
jgi:hypothetical protein